MRLSASTSWRRCSSVRPLSGITGTSASPSCRAAARPPVTGDDVAVLAHQDRVGEAERRGCCRRSRRPGRRCGCGHCAARGSAARSARTPGAEARRGAADPAPNRGGFARHAVQRSQVRSQLLDNSSSPAHLRIRDPRQWAFYLIRIFANESTAGPQARKAGEFGFPRPSGAGDAGSKRKRLESTSSSGPSRIARPVRPHSLAMPNLVIAEAAGALHCGEVHLGGRLPARQGSAILGIHHRGRDGPRPGVERPPVVRHESSAFFLQSDSSLEPPLTEEVDHDDDSLFLNLFFLEVCSL